MGEEPTRIEDDLPDAHLFWIEIVPSKLAEIAQFLENGQAPEGMSEKKKKILAMKVAPSSIINRFLYKLGLYKVLRWCIMDHERESIMHEAHYGPAGGHFQSDTTTNKIE